eukprot:m51a1_g13142 hypothetical protein (301) ;mRNA; r:277-1709
MDTDTDGADGSDEAIHTLSSAIAGAALYASLALAVCVSGALMLRRKLPSRKTVVALFHVSLLAFCFVRAAWFCVVIVRTTVVDILISVASRLGLCLFFTNFTLVVYFWTEQFVSHFIRGRKYLPVVRRVVVCINIAVYAAFVLLLVPWWLIKNQNTDGSVLYNATLYSIIAMTGLLQAMVVLLGLWAWLQYRSVQWYDSSDGAEVRRVIGAAAVLAVCCTLRMVMFFDPGRVAEWREEVFYALAYWVPELVSSVVESTPLPPRRSGRREREAKEVIESLFNEAHGVRSYDTIPDSWPAQL